MSKTLPWWVLLIGAIIFYGISTFIAGPIGVAINLLGLILLCLAIVNGVQAFRKKKKDN